MPQGDVVGPKADLAIKDRLGRMPSEIAYLLAIDWLRVFAGLEGPVSSRWPFRRAGLGLASRPVGVSWRPATRQEAVRAHCARGGSGSLR